MSPPQNDEYDLWHSVTCLSSVLMESNSRQTLAAWQVWNELSKPIRLVSINYYLNGNLLITKCRLILVEHNLQSGEQQTYVYTIYIYFWQFGLTLATNLLALLSLNFSYRIQTGRLMCHAWLSHIPHIKKKTSRTPAEISRMWICKLNPDKTSNSDGNEALRCRAGKNT